MSKGKLVLLFLLALLVAAPVGAQEPVDTRCPATTLPLTKYERNGQWDGPDDVITIMSETDFFISWQVNPGYTVASSVVKAGQAVDVVWYAPWLVGGSMGASVSPNGQAISHVEWCEPEFPTSVSVGQIEGVPMFIDGVLAVLLVLVLTGVTVLLVGEVLYRMKRHD